MKKFLCLLLLTMMFSVQTLGCSYAVNDYEEEQPNKVIIDEQEDSTAETIKDDTYSVKYVSLAHSDIYNCLSDSISDETRFVIEQYIESQIEFEQYTNVILLDVWYNEEESENQFLLLFDGNYFHQIAVADDLSYCDTIYNSYVPDYTLQVLGYK